MDVEELIKKNSSNSSEEIVVNEFTEESAQKFRDSVMEIVREGDPMRPIVVYIDSYGGAVDALAKMIETMNEVPNPMITVCVGKSMSCGAVLLSHGDIRFMGKNSRVMIHEVSGGVQNGDVHDMYADAQEVKRLNKHFMDLLARNCGIKGGYEVFRKMIKSQDGRDNYMNAERALKYGIIDHIGLPTVSKLTIYKVDISPETGDPATRNFLKSIIENKRFH